MGKKKVFFYAILCLAVFIMAACASPGTPDGGEWDETPPKVVGTSPAERAVNSTTKKITLTFDEFIKLSNASEKVVISPPQIVMPEIKASGRRIVVELQDSLKKNTTYSIDFSDAIQDNNEGNPMGNYAFTFSTGEVIDTMEVAGTVLEAQNLEPIKGILVGLHSDISDSAFIKKPFERVARTNGSGKFVIKGVAPGSYRVYALEDADGDFAYTQKGEKLAFQSQLITTASVPAVRNDTLWRDSTHIDSIKQVTYTRFLPDDVVLRAFTVKQTERHLLKTERLDPYKFSLYFTAPSEKQPIVKGLDFDKHDAFLISANETNDTLTYWIKDTTLAHRDTLGIILSYQETNDSTGIDTTAIDTLFLTPRTTYARILKKQNDDLEKWTKEMEKAKKKNRKFGKMLPYKLLNIINKGSGTLDLDKNISISFPEPIERIDTAGIHLLLKKDTSIVEAPFKFRKDEKDELTYNIYGEWRPGQQYTFRIDSLAIRSIYGKENSPLEFNSSVPSLDAYSSLFLNLKGMNDSCMIVQLLSSSDKVVRSVRCNKNRADFYYVRPGTYYLRVFVDSNCNGVWDTGDFYRGLQPEEVFYYPASLQLRARWDVEQDWDVKTLELPLQKPSKITKQKPDKEKKIESRNAKRAREQK